MSSVRTHLTLVLLALLATVAAALLAVGPRSARAAHPVEADRVAGNTRYETAAELARLQFPEGTTTAIVAPGQTYPDALAGAGLAGAADAPVLLARRDEVPAATSAALEDLGVQHVYLLGGVEALGRHVQNTLVTHYEITRLAGPTRYGTAAAVAEEAVVVQGEAGRIAGLTTAFIASGQTFPDALTAGSLATTQSTAFPVLLVGQDTTPQATRQAIQNLGIEQAIIIGGQQAVGDQVQAQLEEDTTSVLRLAGPTRQATAVEVADFAMMQFNYTGELTLLARADGFADALTAGLHAGRHDAAILLAGTNRLAHPTATWLHDLCPTVEVVRAVGGPAAISQQTLDDAQQQARHCHSAEGQTGETYIVQPTTPVTATPGTTVDLSVEDRHDQRPLQEPLDVALFPCPAVDRATGTFADTDGDGRADHIATTETGQATIRQASDAEQIRDGYAHNARFLHGVLSWTLHSNGPDCTVTVVFDDHNNDDALAVDGQGHPLEHYGARQVHWSTGG